MNALALELLGVAKDYLGPAAPAFLSRELHALGVNANNVERSHILPLAERARLAASRVMDNKKASEFAQALAQQGRAVEAKAPHDHRLASEAAAKLFAGGRLRQAEAAYRELVNKHGDIDSYSGLARTLVSLEDRDAALLALREGAATFARKNDRVNAIGLLGVAVRTHTPAQGVRVVAARGPFVRHDRRHPRKRGTEVVQEQMQPAALSAHLDDDSIRYLQHWFTEPAFAGVSVALAALLPARLSG